MATSFDIEVEQGGNYTVSLIASGGGAALNLNNYGLSGHARYRYGSTGYLIDLAPTKVTGAANITGHFTIDLDSSELTIPFGQFLYSIEAYSGVTVHKLYQGDFNVLPEITF